MPAPVLPFIPTTADGRASPGFVPGQSYMGRPTLWPQQQVARPQIPGMGDFMSMNQVNPGPAAAAGAEPWVGPWVNMNELTAGAPLNTEGQAFSQTDHSGFGGMGNYLTEADLRAIPQDAYTQSPWLTMNQVAPGDVAHPSKHQQTFGGLGEGHEGRKGGWWKILLALGAGALAYKTVFGK